MYSTSKLCFILLFILSLPVIIEIEYVLDIWLGDNIPDHTPMFVTLVIISSLVCVFNPAMSFVVHATGKMRLYQVVGSLTDLLILPVSYVVLKMGYQPESVFVIYIIFSVIQQYVCLVIVKGLVYFSIGDYMRETSFAQNWTIYYWAYWIVWCCATPFFIALISKGRTIKNMVLGTYGWGLAGTFMSFIIIGNYGLAQELKHGVNISGFIGDGGSMYDAILKIFDTLP